jgi:hypothetical protein
MAFRRWVAQLDLVALLLFAATIELVLNRLAVPVLRPPAGAVPPGWHRNLDVAGLFSLHLASALAFGVTARGLWLRATRNGLPGVLRWALFATGAVFLGVAAWNLVTTPGTGEGRLLEFAFMAFITMTVIAAIISEGASPLVKIGLVLLLVPFAVHFYATLRLAMLPEAEAQWSILPARVRELGQHAVALCALWSPVFFGPRPLLTAAARPTPMIIAAVVASLATVVLQRHLEIGVALAQLGLGFDLGPGAPPVTLALYVSAAATSMWTITSCLLSPARARRQIGIGFALVVVAGYGFAWPLAYLTIAAGLLVMLTGALKVREQESLVRSPTFSTPAIPGEAWQRYVQAVTTSLDADASVNVTDSGDEVTSIAGRRQGRPFVLRLGRQHGRLTCLDVVVSASEADAAVPADGVPAWTMSTRPGVAAGVHPPAPEHTGDVRKTGDAVFDRRFKIIEPARAGHTERLLDDGLRARAAAVLDGWLALYPGHALQYRVHPGKGAPLDHPVPITALTFGTPADPGAERLVNIVDLVTAIAARV